MKNNLIKRFVFIILITICVFSLTIPNVYAIGNVITSADSFIGASTNGTSDVKTIDDTTLKEMSNLTFNILLVVGIIVAVIFGLIIAIQFITGSVEEKAKVKETLIPYIAGCVVLFGAFTIWKIVVTIMQTI